MLHSIFNKVKALKTLKFIFKSGAAVVVLILLFSLWSNYIIKSSSEAFIYVEPTDIPFNDVALVLGTSKATKGYSNPYFRYRIDAAVALYESGKIKHIIVSGDNSRKGYNEPQDMKDALMQKGVPGGVITMDYAGFRTFDSVVRLKAVFGQSKVTIISQKFHLQRAIYIAKAKGIDAVGFVAKDVNRKNTPNIRAYLAKTKAVLDCYFLGTKPKFLGAKISLNVVN